MKERLYGLFSDESLIGRITSRIWILFGANILFVLFSIPVVTAIPAAVAMYHVCLMTLRHDSQLNPFRAFWDGFRSNFRQAFLAGLAFLAVLAILLIDVLFVSKAGGFMDYFRWPVYLLTGFVLLVMFHFFPVMAAFDDSTKGLLRNSMFFAAKNPMRAVIILALNVGPMALTYRDPVRMPLYAFLWVTVGFSAIAMIESRLLLKDFEKYLGPVPDPEDLDTIGHDSEELTESDADAGDASAADSDAGDAHNGT